MFPLLEILQFFFEASRTQFFLFWTRSTWPGSLEPKALGDLPRVLERGVSTTSSPSELPFAIPECISLRKEEVIR